jgi:hypothetical protein
MNAITIVEHGPREMIAGDLYGDQSVPVGEFGFKPASNVFPDGGATLHGKTHAEMCRITRPNDPDSWCDGKSIHIALDGPRGTIHGYVDADIFVAVCEALGVQS